jgi:hypothetical protein
MQRDKQAFWKLSPRTVEDLTCNFPFSKFARAAVAGSFSAGSAGADGSANSIAPAAGEAQAAHIGRNCPDLIIIQLNHLKACISSA